jgi:hypothetical protein
MVGEKAENRRRIFKNEPAIDDDGLADDVLLKLCASMIGIHAA